MAGEIPLMGDAGGKAQGDADDREVWRNSPKSLHGICSGDLVFFYAITFRVLCLYSNPFLTSRG